MIILGQSFGPYCGQLLRRLAKVSVCNFLHRRRRRRQEWPVEKADQWTPVSWVPMSLGGERRATVVCSRVLLQRTTWATRRGASKRQTDTRKGESFYDVAPALVSVGPKVRSSRTARQRVSLKHARDCLSNTPETVSASSAHFRQLETVCGPSTEPLWAWNFSRELRARSGPPTGLSLGAFSLSHVHAKRKPTPTSSARRPKARL